MTKVNRIYVPAYKEDRLRYFQKYYNVLGLETNIEITLILDDRYRTRESYDLSGIDFHKEIFWSSDIIADCRNLFTNKENYDRILKIYAPSLKMLVFIWLHKFKGIDKSMLLDDDVLYLKPVDEAFQNDFMIKKEMLSRVSGSLASVFRKVWPDRVDDINTNLLNSGTIIYTYDESNGLIEDADSFFSSPEILSELEAGYEKRLNVHRIRGRAWILEQYFFGFHFINIKKKHKVVDFRTYVNLVTVYPKENSSKTIKKLPYIYHFLPMIKEPLYEHYTKLVDAYLEKNT